MRALLAALFAATAALAQTPTEHVTVTGTKSREAIAGFVQSLARPTRMTGKLARWETPICPLAVGLKPAHLKFITDRLKQVATQAGAPFDARPDCRVNVQIIFTTAPQALLDTVRKKQPTYLGYHDSEAQADRMARVLRPIQAWYMTATRDLRGKEDIDGARNGGFSMHLQLPPPYPPSTYFDFTPSGNAASVSGSRLGDGLHSAFHNVIVVVDPNKLLQQGMGAVADYIALVALTQPADAGACLGLPSILNLLAAACAPVEALTDNDRGYLRGLYHMSPAQSVAVQQDEVGYQMQQQLAGQ